MISERKERAEDVALRTSGHGRYLLATPQFTRGSGLGNRLFQWAECKVFCYQSVARFVAPRWWRPVLGHLLRGTVASGNPLAQMAYVGLFQRGPGELPWWRGMLPRITQKAVSAGRLSAIGVPQKGALIVFDRNSCSFQPLNAFHEQLGADLLAITRRRSLDAVKAYGEPCIGMHLRFGDFRPPPSGGAGTEWVGWLQQTPVEWFIETLALVRRAAGRNVPVVVASDGTRQQLAPLLELPEVVVLPPTNALVDLLTLARCRLLLGTGSSTFSAWAAFLGQQTAVTAPGKPMTNWGLEPQHGQLIGVFHPRQPNPSTMDAMLGALRKPSALSLHKLLT